MSTMLDLKTVVLSTTVQRAEDRRIPVTCSTPD